ncbi:MAG: DUF1501 domain-containing protein [Planctomycetota bacterium]|nr:DUF1501 domain-containing protein [Planctomycetota bacterium]
MLPIDGNKFQHGDRVSRRSLLVAGAAGFGGLTLPNLLRAEAAEGIRSSNKAVINIHLDGGPPQMDTIDPKPGAPEEVRGEFAAIPTTLPGFWVSELMPKLASIADRCGFIRSLVGSAGSHDAFQCQSGFAKQNLEAIGGRPAMGSIVSKLLSRPTDPVPAFVDLMQGRPLVRNSARPGFLGPAYGPFRPDMSKMFNRQLEDSMKKELAQLGKNHATSLTINAELQGTRLSDRKQLLAALDQFHRQVDATGAMEAVDRFTQQAIGILTSGRFAEALDLAEEDPKVVARYTPLANESADRFRTAEGPKAILKFLLARRLIEAGVRCVSLSISDFDTHSKNFPRMRNLVPLVDFGLHALITDLDDRGMLDDVSIIAWGEFGRTPKVNKNGGRDHWPNVAPAILAGGGMRVGQVIGATDKTAGTAVRRPVHYQDVFATLYHNLGIDPTRTTIDDLRGRPRFLLDNAGPIAELV